MQIEIEPHPRLVAGILVVEWERPLGELATPAALGALLRPDAATPFQPDDAVRSAVRDLLRVGGYKPTGRGKPASEYLTRAAQEGTLGPINVAVDSANAVSLHSGVPISVVDTASTRPPLRIGIAPPGARYVFNAAGQEIELAGLLCLFDAEGPCANAVRDAQRTKTTSATTSTLSILWGVIGHEARLQRALDWYRELLPQAAAVRHSSLSADGTA
jgi:DNA/RNA-binding domain of Phe-tRNA-synthetase-like protein